MYKTLSAHERERAALDGARRTFVFTCASKSNRTPGARTHEIRRSVVMATAGSPYQCNTMLPDAVADIVEVPGSIGTGASNEGDAIATIVFM